MPLRLPQGNIASRDIICRQLSFIDGTEQTTAAAGIDGTPITPSRITLPQINEPLTPTFSFGDGDSGFYEESDDNLSVAIAGVRLARFGPAGFTIRSGQGNGPALMDEVASDINPVLIPDSADIDTGIGHSAANQLALIAGGLRVMNLIEDTFRVQAIVPLQNNASFPSIAFGDGDSGFFESVDDTINVSISGISTYGFSSAEFIVNRGSGASLRNATPSATVPVHTFFGDNDTGMGHRTADIGVLIAGAQNCMEFGEAGAAPLVAFYGTAAIAKQAGVAVSAAGIHAALVNLGLIAA